MFYKEGQIEQLGGDSFSENQLNDKTQITEKDGYTYIVSYSYLKDNEIIVKEKEVDFEKLLEQNFESGLYINNFEVFENKILLNADYEDGQANKSKRIYTVTLDSTGEASVQLLKEFSEDVKISIVKGVKGTYFEVCESDGTCNLLDNSGKSVLTFTKGEQYPSGYDKKILFIESTGLLYFHSIDLKAVVAYDTKANDLIWNSDGSAKEFDIDFSNHSLYLGTENGIYSVNSLSTTEFSLKFFTIEKEDLVYGVEGSLITNLEGSKFYVTLDDEYINVFTIVTYHGKPTVQKHSYTRVDS